MRRAVAERGTNRQMTDSSNLMAGKRGLIMGVANNRSIAWGITKVCAEHGADIALTYQGDTLKKRVEMREAEREMNRRR